MKFKQPKTWDEQLTYLNKEKRVVFNVMSRKDAKEALVKYGYIHLVTPFKHLFAKTKKGKVIKENNRHVYERDVDFDEYFEKYKDERMKYPILFQQISAFETSFNAIVSHCVINYYAINSENAFDQFVDNLKGNLLLNDVIVFSAKKHMLNEMNRFKEKLQIGSVYLFFDRLTLNSIITIYKTCDLQLKNDIFNKLIECGCTFGYYDQKTFDDFLTRLVPIRNCVYHNNSLEVLYQYFSIEKNILRTDSDKRRYKNVVKRILETKKTT